MRHHIARIDANDGFDRQKNMDYCLFQVSQFLHGILLLLVLYDVWCFYYKHLLWRFENCPALSLPDNLTITGGVGQFHVHAHRAECYARFSPNFIPGAGQQLIEFIEPNWIETNEVSGSTRGMSTGHRQEFLDDHMNDSNWYKMTRLGACYLYHYLRSPLNMCIAVALTRKWEAACSKVGPAMDAFDDLTKNSSPDNVKEWTQAAESAAAERHTDYEAMDIYAVQSVKREQAHSARLSCIGPLLNAQQCQHSSKYSWSSPKLRTPDVAHKWAPRRGLYRASSLRSQSKQVLRARAGHIIH